MIEQDYVRKNTDRFSLSYDLDKGVYAFYERAWPHVYDKTCGTIYNVRDKDFNEIIDFLNEILNGIQLNGNHAVSETTKERTVMIHSCAALASNRKLLRLVVYKFDVVVRTWDTPEERSRYVVIGAIATKGGEDNAG